MTKAIEGVRKTKVNDIYWVSRKGVVGAHTIVEIRR